MTARSRITVVAGIFLVSALVTAAIVTRNRNIRSQHSNSITPSQPSVPIVAQARAAVDRAAKWAKSEAMLHLPIEFYGRVIDQNGEAVPQATIHVSVVDRRDKPGSQYVRIADEKGHFTANGIGGYSFGVSVEKPGYYPVETSETQVGSSDSFDNNPDDLHRYKPDKNNPVVFRLHKQGTVAPLIKLRERSFQLRTDGLPVELPLEDADHKIERRLIIRLWVPDPKRNARGTFDWKAEILAQNGRLRQRADEFDFVAPLDGYDEKMITEMPATLSRPQWKDDLKELLFVRFEDEMFARIDLRIIAGGDHFCLVKGFINPTPGSRNLETPPN
jgi:hypothetical protein